MMKETTYDYMTPAVEYLDCSSEGVLCASNEKLGESIGVWNINEI